MPDSLAVQAAKAVVAALAAKSDWPTSFTPAWTFAPSFSLEQLQTLRVTVAPTKRTLTRATRGSAAQTITLGIGVQQYTPDPARCEALALLVDALADWILSDANPLAVTDVEQTVFFDPDHWRQSQVFTAVLSFTIRAA